MASARTWGKESRLISFLQHLLKQPIFWLPMLQSRSQNPYTLFNCLYFLLISCITGTHSIILWSLLNSCILLFWHGADTKWNVALLCTQHSSDALYTTYYKTGLFTEARKCWNINLTSHSQRTWSKIWRAIIIFFLHVNKIDLERSMMTLKYCFQQPTIPTVFWLKEM